MKIIGLNEVERTKVNMEGARDAFKQVPISKGDGTPCFSLRVFTIEPGGYTPHHKHPFEHLNYVIEGEGTLVSEAGTERPLKKGDFALVLPDEVHQYRNRSSDKPFMMICGVPKEYE